jgi:hypothetical protein
MLFYCSWDDAASFLVDAPSEAKAREAATEQQDGSPPDRVRPFPPNTFAVEIVVESSETDDDDVMTLEPLEHVAEVLWAWEDEGESEGGHLPPIVGDHGAACVSEATLDDAGTLARCTLLAGHRGSHKAKGMVWE